MVPASIGSLYERAIVETGRQPELLFFVAFLASFGLVRLSTHMIRAGVPWWPGNLEVGGTHVHHLVWGILLLLVAGYAGVTVAPPSPWHELLAVLFGIGAALTLDEFALWLNLEDVYWSEKGRRSIDAVIVAATLSGMAVLGFGAWVELADEIEREVFAAVGAVAGVTVAAAIVNLAKGKLGVALAGLLVPVVGMAGALRLGRPESLWGRLFYRSEARRTRAVERFGQH